MSNLIIVSDNIARTASIVSDSTAGALIADNLKKDSKSEVWRSVGTTATLTVTFSASLPISCVSLAFCNLSPTATMRVVIGAFDTGYLSVSEYSLLDKMDFSGSLNANAYNYGGGNYATLHFAQQTASSATIYISDAANTNGYIEAGFLIVGRGWTPVYNADYGAKLMAIDSSTHTRSEAGDLKVKRGSISKRISFTLSNMATADRTEFTEMLLLNGKSTLVFISIFPASANTQEKQVYQIYGYMAIDSSVIRVRFAADEGQVDVYET